MRQSHAAGISAFAFMSLHEGDLMEIFPLDRIRGAINRCGGFTNTRIDVNILSSVS